MAKTRTLTDAERRYLEERLAPVFRALREDEALQEEFLLFMKARGSGFALTLMRLKTIWWRGRKSMYPGFLVLGAVEFGIAHGLLQPKGTVRKRRS